MEQIKKMPQLVYIDGDRHINIISLLIDFLAKF